VNFNDIKLDCSRNRNNVEVVDSNNWIYNFCLFKAGRTLKFTTFNSNWLLLIVRGTVEFNMKIDYIDPNITPPTDLTTPSITFPITNSTTTTTTAISTTTTTTTATSSTTTTINTTVTQTTTRSPTTAAALSKSNLFKPR